MRLLIAALTLLSASIANIACAEVTAAAANGFTIRHEVTVSASRADAWRFAVGDVGQWWSGDHTITGDARNMSIDARPLGCFCETVGDYGGVVHLTVTFVNPGVLLRMTGGLGPLGLMGATGNMLWEFSDTTEGTGIRFTYAVGGFHPDGFEELADGVDYVIGEALQRLAAYADTNVRERPAR